MARRLYIVPKIGTGAVDDHYRPKYFMTVHNYAQAPDIAAVFTMAFVDFGWEQMMLVSADTTAAEHTSITANADVVAIPINLDNNVGVNLATVQSKLESLNIPADWVTSGMTFRQVVRFVTQYADFMNRYQAKQLVRFLNAVTLDSTVGDLSLTVRQKMQEVADDNGLSTQGITLTTTIRSALKIIAQQLPFIQSVGGFAL